MGRACTKLPWRPGELHVDRLRRGGEGRSGERERPGECECPCTSLSPWELDGGCESSAFLDAERLIACWNHPSPDDSGRKARFPQGRKPRRKTPAGRGFSCNEVWSLRA